MHNIRTRLEKLTLKSSVTSKNSLYVLSETVVVFEESLKSHGLSPIAVGVLRIGDPTINELV